MPKPFTAKLVENPRTLSNNSLCTFIHFTIKDASNGQEKKLLIKASLDYTQVREATIYLDDPNKPLEHEKLCSDNAWQTVLLRAWRDHFLHGDLGNSYNQSFGETFELKEYVTGYTYVLTTKDLKAIADRRAQALAPYSTRHGDGLDDFHLYCEKQRILQLGKSNGFGIATRAQSTQQHWLIRFLPELSGGLLFLAGVAILMTNPATTILAVGLMAAGLGMFAGSQIRARMIPEPTVEEGPAIKL